MGKLKIYTSLVYNSLFSKNGLSLFQEFNKLKTRRNV